MKNLFKNKKIIITGHTGFKGSWLTLWLNRLGADILGLSIDTPTLPSHFKLLNLKKIKSKKIDVSNFKKLNKEIKKFKPDFIFHLAAQAIVKKSYLNPIQTFNTNLMGTVNLLHSLKENKKETVSIIITSDKTYKNIETQKGYKENDTLGGEDPYGASKSAADIAVKCYVKSFFNKKNNKNLIAVARAGNVIGGGDWSDGRLIPDCMRSWLIRKTVNIRNPNATRPWQHVLDVVNGYLTLAVSLKKNKKLHGEAFNFGPDMNKNYKVIDILKKSKKNWPSIKWKIMAKHKFKENYLLNLNNNKARRIIKWEPVLDINNTIKLTIDWYKNYLKKNKDSIKKQSLKQIKDFEKLLKI